MNKAMGAMAMHPSTWARWLHIQWHRAEIRRLLRSGAAKGSPEIARRMNAIAQLCDCGRTPTGMRLAESLANDEGIGLSLSDSEEPC